MSSTDSKDNITTTNNSSAKSTTIGAIASLGLKLTKGGLFGPLTAGISGTKTIGSFFIYTTAGRLIILVLLLFISYRYVENYFTNRERSEWEELVNIKQDDILDKVEIVDDLTRSNQAVANSKVSYWESVMIFLGREIPKVQPPHPIESETIDLINQTRDEPKDTTSFSN